MLHNAKRWAPRGAWRYGVAIVGALAAFGARQLLHPVLETHMPALFFTITAVLVGFRLGLGPAGLVVLIGVPVADYFFVPPYSNFGYFDKEDLILFIGFPSVTLMLLVMIEWLRRTQHEARLLGEVARSRHEMLKRAEKRRRQAEASHSIADKLLRHFTDQHADVMFVCKTGSNYEYVSDALGQEIDALADGSLATLMAALSGADAATLTTALTESDRLHTQAWTICLPRKDKDLRDLLCHVERLPAEHGAYIIVKCSQRQAA
jgi:K+-sensing histidine kinase KdpD